MKEKVYRTQVISRNELIQRIIDAAAEIKQNPQESLRVINSVVHRCIACIDMGGRHFEMRT